MFCQDTIICCTIGDTDNKINYSTVICTNNILTTVITLMIISGASMIKVYTNVANVEKQNNGEILDEIIDKDCAENICIKVL